MKRILSTNSENVTALVARLALAITIFPHGAQKLLGWFGGGGFSGTMGFFTGVVNLPYAVGVLVIMVEFFGSLFLLFGFLTRIAAVGIIGMFTGVVIVNHSSNFFMNWAAEAGRTEGVEYFVLLFGLAVIALIAGGGKASVDSAIANK